MTSDEMDIATFGLPTKSAKIRKLADLGVSRSEIANYLNIRYQHVRNVLVGPFPSPSRAEQKREPAPAPENGDVKPMSIAQAKRALAAHFGVSPDSIEITIRG